MGSEIYPLLLIFAVTYIFIASEKIDKAIAAGLGASAVIALNFVPYKKAMHHVDLNVIFLLIGMMLIVNTLATTGVFEWLAVTVAQRAKGNGLRILIELLVITAVLSALLDNVTTVILIAPITILICQILEIPAVPFLILEAIFSNIGGTATLVGDPPNILIGSQAKIPFIDFIIHLGPIVFVILIVSIIVVYFQLGKRMQVDEAAKKRIMDTCPELAITKPKRLIVSGIIFGLVLLGFFFGHPFHIEPGIIAFGGGLLMVAACRIDLHHMLEKVEWGTILFFIGLFMLVAALEHNGIFIWLGNQVLAVTEGNLFLTCIVILWVSAIASAVVDNIPLVISMLPLVQAIIPEYAKEYARSKGLDVPLDPESVRTIIAYPLYWSLALGACLGGNGSLIGASANVVIAQVARKNKYKLTFWGFTRYGFPMMIVSLLLSTGYIYLRYF